MLLIHGNNLFINNADIMSASHSAAAYVWWFFAASPLSHQAVVGFFVISGWLVGGAVLARIRRKSDFLTEYYIHRVTRIYIVLAPALLLTAAVDALGRSAFAASGVYDGPGFAGHSSLPLFLAALASLQEIFTPFFGSNGPLWSLACEFWYYVTFPLLLLPLARNYSPAARYGGFALGLALIVVLAGQHSYFGVGYLIWGFGAFATLAPRAPIRSRGAALTLYAALLILIRFFVRGEYLAAHPWLDVVADLIGAAGFVATLLAFRDAPQTGFAPLRARLHGTLAGFSFSLYCIHMPLLVFARAAMTQMMGEAWMRQLATPAHYAMTIAVSTLVVGVAYVFSRLTEANTAAARRVLRGWADTLRASIDAPGRVPH